MFGLPDDYLVIEQLWDGLEPSRRIIETLTTKLNAHEERLNRREKTMETMAYQTRQVTAPTTNNNSDDKKKKKKKNDDWKKKVKCFGCGKKGHIARDYSHKKDDDQDGGNKKADAYCSIVDANVTADSWIVNSGASCHIIPRREWFIDEPYVVQVKMADGHQAQSAGRGTILIRALVESAWSDLRLINVLHVPSFDRNLFPTRKVMARGCKIIGDMKSIKFEKNGRVVLAAVLRDDVFVLLIETRNSELCCAAQAGLLRDWHERLGHIHVNAIRTIVRTGAVEGMQIDGDKENFFCELCVIAKQRCPAYPKSERNCHPEAGELVHTNLCNGFETRSLGGAFHFDLFKDDATGQWISYRRSRRYRRR